MFLSRKSITARFYSRDSFFLYSSSDVSVFGDVEESDYQMIMVKDFEIFPVPHWGKFDRERATKSFPFVVSFPWGTFFLSSIVKRLRLLSEYARLFVLLTTALSLQKSESNWNELWRLSGLKKFSDWWLFLEEVIRDKVIMTSLDTQIHLFS